MAGRKKSSKTSTNGKKAKAAPGARPGMPEYEPTEQDRIQVEALVGYGLPYRQISKLIFNPRTGKGISTTTLEKYFVEELARGRSSVLAKVAHSLVQKALSPDHPQAAICAMFYLKCQGRWRQEDKLVHEVEGGTGVLLAPAAMSVADWTAVSERQNGVKTPPGDE